MTNKYQVTSDKREMKIPNWNYRFNESLPSTFNICPDGKVILRLTKGRIEVDPDIEVDEAARKVLDVMEQMYSARYNLIWNEAIEAAAESLGPLKIKREDGQWQQDVIRRLKK